MVCYFPMAGFQGPDNKFTRRKPTNGLVIPMTISCGRCMGCRLDKVRDWKTRMHCEALFHDDVIMANVTYSEACLPEGGSLSVRDHETFVKRLRKWWHKESGQKFRFYVGAEYGDRTKRPHYHYILFGLGLGSFADTEFFKMSGENRLHRSDILDRIWGNGFVNFGDAKGGGFSYAAGYVTKKLTGPLAEKEYARQCPVTGKSWQVIPEFGRMSGGLGREFCERYRSDFDTSGFLIIEGKRVPIPAYFKTKLRGSFETPASSAEGDFVVDDLEVAMRKARAAADTEQNKWNNSPERLKARQESLLLRTKSYVKDRCS